MAIFPRLATERISTSLTLLIAIASLTCDIFSQCARADDLLPESDDFFEKRVRPVLVERCEECHSGETPESDFNVESLASLLRGGKRGPAISPGDPEHSLLILAINHADQLHMPPKSKIPVAEISALTAWVKAGAHWPNAQPTTSEAQPNNVSTELTEQQRAFWAFQPIRRVAVSDSAKRSVGATWVQSPIDHFILDRLNAAGLQPAPPADKRTWLRRVTFDLTGLPPSEAEIAAFVADSAPDAQVKVVDRLLASPRYGERWGRHWLDIARYADSNGLDENLAYANAFRYRDYVIQALNQDKPYDRFLLEQIAGDLLPADDPVPLNERLVATGFLLLGAKMLAEDDPVKMQMDIIDEQIDTIGRAVLALTLGCARCHDHKFDPISTADYYALAGIFKSTRTMENFKVVARWQELALAPAEQIAARDAIKAQIDELSKRIEQMKAATSPAPPSAETGDPNQTPEEKNQPTVEELEEQKKQLTASLPQLPEAMAASEETPQNVRIHIRGSHITLGAEVPRGFPRVLTNDSTATIGGDRSGRLELAQWLTSANQPLTARVIVNRMWQAHFGEGLVRSPDNFGTLGERPTHPELLDYLAQRLIDENWSLKTIHRLILLSATYQMSTTWNESAAAIDPENRLYWRWNRRRLEAEAIRDSILAVSDTVDFTMGGTMLTTKNREYVTSTANVDPVVYRSNRRSVYLPVVRSALYDVFQAFDFPDPSVSNGRRDSTNVAPQALFMMNSALVSESALKVAESIQQQSVEDADAVQQIFNRALAREATPEEQKSAIDYLQRIRTEYQSAGIEAASADLRAWQSLCRAIISTNEFIYLE